MQMLIYSNDVWCAITEVINRFWWRWRDADNQEALDGALGRRRADES
jgi:hypothetical protein